MHKFERDVIRLSAFEQEETVCFARCPSDPEVTDMGRTRLYNFAGIRMMVMITRTVMTVMVL